MADERYYVLTDIARHLGRAHPTILSAMRRGRIAGVLYNPTGKGRRRHYTAEEARAIMRYFREGDPRRGDPAELE